MRKLNRIILIGALGFLSNISLGQNQTNTCKVELLAINSLSDDYSPTFYKQGLVFISNRNPGFAIKRLDSQVQKPFSDLYIVDFISNIQTLNPKNVGFLGLDSMFFHNYATNSINDSKVLGQYASQKKQDKIAKISSKLCNVRLVNSYLQTKYNDGPVFFSDITNDFYVTRNNYFQGKEKKGSNGKNNLQIYMIKDCGGTNFYLRKFPHNNDNYSLMHPTLTLDGNIIIFASNQSGGYGGFDLYYSIKNNESWSKPQNMGPKINTSKDDLYPYLDPDGDLYYSTSGFKDEGDLDIYYVKLNKKEVLNEPKNLSFPINTPFDDFGFIIKNDVAFMSSNRLGNDDIYRVIYSSTK